VGMAEEDFQWSLRFGHIHPVLVVKRLYDQNHIGLLFCD
jgi:hypothetical protein